MDLDETLALLSGAKPDVVLYGCTSATLTHGPAFDRDLAARIQREAGPRPSRRRARWSTRSRTLGATRIAFASPYVPAINDMAIAFLAEMGIETVSRADFDGTLSNEGQGALTPGCHRARAARRSPRRAGRSSCPAPTCGPWNVSRTWRRASASPWSPRTRRCCSRPLQTLGIAEPVPGFGQLAGDAPTMTFDEIAAFALGPADIPDAALDAAATLLIDTLGVAAGAARWTAAASCATTPCGSSSAPNAKDAAPLLFDGRMASLPGAAFRAGHADRQSRRP
jgi:maleate isomerase